MRPPHRLLDRNRVHRLAAEHLQAHLKFKDYKRKTSAQVLWALLLAAAARITSLSDTCQRLRDAPSDETARKALLATLPDYATLQRQLNASLAGHLPKALRKHLQRLAIDLTLIPYHGRPFRNPDEIYRGQAKSGTSHFHAYATAYVIRKGQRYTVALTGVKKGESLKEVVQRLLHQAARVGIRPRLLLLDRGFYSVAVVRYLQAARVPFLMPVVFTAARPSTRRPQRQLCLPDVDEKRLVYLHPGRSEGAAGGGVDLREVPELSRAVEAARASGVDLRLLGLSAAVAGRGVHDLPAAVRDRDELPSDARGADPDDDPPTGGAPVVRGNRAGTAEPLGVAAFYAPGDAPPRRSGDHTGTAPVGDVVALVASCGRGGLRDRRCYLHRRRCRT
ncbi:MAG: transposase [Planctomycetaceae bacterium]|nr:transposase [Planctomycetaceae bacterium]